MDILFKTETELLWSIRALSVYSSLWDEPNNWESLQFVLYPSQVWLRWDKVKDLMCVLSWLQYVSHSDIHPTCLCKDLYNSVREASWTLCILFIDALWLWSCWLCSQSCWCFLSRPTGLIILSHPYSSFHIGYCVCGAFCAVISRYDANNAFIFSISLVIKKLFSCIFMSFFIVFHLFCSSCKKKRLFSQVVLLHQKHITKWAPDVSKLHYSDQSVLWSCFIPL